VARAVIVGTPASPGRGLGRVLIATAPSSVESAQATLGTRRADAVSESERLRHAFEATAAELTELAARISSESGEEVAAILEAQALIALDPALMERALGGVAAGVSAEEAVGNAVATLAGTLDRLGDVRFQARGADVRDVGHRIVRHLAGRAGDCLWHADGAPAIIVAEDLAPSEMATLEPARVAGLALAGGTVTGHVAIVARALGLPLVLGLGAAVLAITPDSTVVVDGSAGRVLVDPDAGEIGAASSA
jgi:phosphoenolpyruvate-protein kinase (PTS system EI component)